MCLKTLSNEEMDDNFRHSALEVLVSLAEANAPMVRKHCSQFIPEIRELHQPFYGRRIYSALLSVNQCLILMVDLEEDPDWFEAEDSNEDDDDSNATIGETSLDRIACALGGKTVLAPCLARISPIMQSGKAILSYSLIVSDIDSFQRIGNFDMLG